MARSVVLESCPRCERCRFAHRWCICGAFQSVELPFALDVMIHNREFYRPTSTGRLINRVVPASRAHVFQRGMPIARDSIVKPGGELWVLHPLGEALPKGPLPENLQVLLLDGSWREAARMRQMVEPWGRAISLPMSGESRYRLRGQQGDSMHSTIEALMFLLNAVGLTEQERVMRIQFELHVYAGLRTRGAKILADEYIENSILKEAVPELLADLNRRRPNAEASGTPPVRKPKEPTPPVAGPAPAQGSS